MLLRELWGLNNMPFKSRKQQQWYNSTNQNFYDDYTLPERNGEGLLQKIKILEFELKELGGVQVEKADVEFEDLGEGLQEELMNIGQNIIHDPNIHDLLHHIPHVLAHAVASAPKKSYDKPFNMGGYENPERTEKTTLQKIIDGEWVGQLPMKEVDSREEVKSDDITGTDAEKGSPTVNDKLPMNGFALQDPYEIMWSSESEFDDFMSNINIQDDDKNWWQHKTHEGQWDLNDDGEVTDEEWFKTYSNNVDYSKSDLWGSLGRSFKKALTGKEEWKPESETKWGELETNPHLLKELGDEAEEEETRVINGREETGTKKQLDDLEAMWNLGAKLYGRFGHLSKKEREERRGKNTKR